VVKEVCTSADALAYLDRANLFLVALDDKRVWYRYHQLFADLLQSQLHQSLGTGEVAQLHLRAAAWYEQNGLTLDAIYQASLAGDLEGVERLIERNYFELMNRGELSSMALWTKKLSKEQLYSRPRLCIYEAMSRLWFGKLDEADFLLNKAEQCIRSLPPRADTASKGFLTYVQSRFSALRGDMRQAIALNVQARQNTPTNELAMQLTIGITLGMEYFLYGDFKHAVETLQEVIQWGYTCPDISDGVAAYALLGRLYAVQGRLLKAHKQLQKAALWLDQSGSSLLGVSALIDLGFAAILCERNDLDTALSYANKGLDRIPSWGKVDDLVLGYIVLARILAAQNNRVAAGQAVEKACQLVQACAVFSEARAAVEAAQVRFWLDTGNMQPAASWAGAFDIKAADTDDPFQFQVELARMTYARVCLAQKRWDPALEMLTSLEENARTNGRMGRLIEILILKALALHDLGDTVQANRALERSLQLAAPQGYLRIFLDEGQPVQMLLAQWLAHTAPGPLRAYAVSLLSRFDDRLPEAEKKAHQFQNLIEPLSQRELEVLHLMALGRTNQEIAGQLIVSTGTIKAHAASIYRKLDVNNRTEAVAHARKLGILP
jgi:LuxR family transcriptional regulator, maltose regulon positive regulatory protein